MTENKNLDNQVIKSEKSNKAKLTQIITIILGAFSLVILIYMKIQNPNFSWKWFLIIGGGVIIASFIIIFGFIFNKRYIDEKEKNDNKDLPPQATEEQMKERISEVLSSIQYQNHVREWKDIIPYNIGGNMIYDFKIIPLYGEKDEVMHIIINSHFIKNLPAILINPTDYKLKQIINSLSTHPNQEPIQEKRVERDLSGGREVIYEKKGGENKKEENKDKKVDIA